MEIQTLTVFVGTRAAGSGERAAVIDVLRELSEAHEQEPVLVFDDHTGGQVDLDLRQTPQESAAEAAAPEQRGPGRPKLGVVGREVTLLPRHWEWLNAQPGGASVALRKLVEQARRDNEAVDRARLSQEATYRFMTAMAGNEPGFEEACRALYAGDLAAFQSRVAEWPDDVAAYAGRLAEDAFADVETSDERD